MKRFIIFLTMMLTAFSPKASSQETFDALWADFETARREGRPRTQEEILGRIVDKARTEGIWQEEINALQRLVPVVAQYNWKDIEQAVERFASMEEDFKTPVSSAIHTLALLGQMSSYRYNIAGCDQAIRSRLETLYGKLPAYSSIAVDSSELASLRDADRILPYRWKSFVPAANLAELVCRCIDALCGDRYYNRDYPLREEFSVALASAVRGLPDNTIVAQCLAAEGMRNTALGSSGRTISILDGLIARYPEERAAVIPKALRLELLQDIALSTQDDDVRSTNLSMVSSSAEELLSAELPDDLRSALESILTANDSQECAISSATPVYPSSAVPITIRHKNLSRFHTDIFRIRDGYQFSFGDNADVKEEEILRFASPYSSFDTTLDSRYGIGENDTLTADIGRAGRYLVRVTPGDRPLGHSRPVVVEMLQLTVSTVAVAGRSRQGSAELYPVDLLSGKPLKSGRVSLVNGKRASGSAHFEEITASLTERLSFDGFTKSSVRSGDRYGQLRVENGADIYSPALNIYIEQPSKSGSSETRGAVIHTDRKLYKPSDTVRFKYIEYRADHKEGKAVPGSHVTLNLYAPGESKAISTLSLVTNRFGSASGEFVIPEGYMNGWYSIGSRNPEAYAEFRVEEYNRPSFTVDLDPVQGIYSFGDSVRVTGMLKSYAGYGISDGSISYRIWINSEPLYRTYIRFDREMIAQGVVSSGPDGRFSIPFEAAAPRGVNSNMRCASYSVEMTCTDPQGETHEASLRLLSGDIPLLLSADIPSDNIFNGQPVIDRTKDGGLSFTVTNLAGEPCPTEGFWELKLPGKTVRKGTFDRQGLSTLKWKDLQSGSYELTYSVEYEGKTISGSDKFIAFSPDDRHSPAEGELFYCTIADENAIDFVIGTTEKDLWLECELFTGDTRLWRSAVHLQNGMKHITLPYPDKYDDAVYLSAFAIRDGRQYEAGHEFRRVRDHSLPLTIESFRDRTSPLSNETFTIHTAPDVEAMVSVFDITTDRLGSNSFNFQPFRNFYAGHSRIYTNISDGPRRGYLTKSVSTAVMAANYMAVPDGVAYAEDEALALEAPQTEAASGAVQEAVLRSDFAESLAFLAQLQSGSDGRIEVNFKTSDALSTYRVLMLLHDRSLNHSTAERALVVSKSLMVSPNLPQFLREGDRIILKSKVVNLSEKAVEGDASISFFNGADTGPLDMDLRSVHLKLEAGGQGEASWEVVAPEGVSLLGVRIMFTSPDGSDGELNLIPVVPARTLMTDAVSVIMDGKGRYSVDLSKMIQKKDVSDGTLIFEVSTPMTAVLEALPSASKVRSSNLIDYLSALYVTQVGSYLVEKYPDVRRVAERLAAEGPAANPLEMNSRITGVLLSETPWAYRPALDLRRAECLSDILDSDRAERLSASYRRQIAKFQMADGGFAWYSGMESSLQLTMFLLEHYARLSRDCGYEPSKAEKDMLGKALDYLDSQLKAMYDSYLENCRRNGSKPDTKHLDDTALTLLKVLSLYPEHSVAQASVEAYDHYLASVADSWAKGSIAQKASAARLLYAVGDRSYVRICRSLVEYAVDNGNAGCYFPNAVMPFRGLMSTEIYAHSELLKLFDNLAPELAATGKASDRLLSEKMSSIVRGLGRWLMIQKHNQDWENNAATMDAISALLSSGVSGSAASQALERTEMSLDDFLARNAGAMSYTFVNSDDALRTGSVYYLYTQSEALSEAFSNQMSLERSWWRISEGDACEPLAEGETLHPGDRIAVRYVIENTENRSFVHLQASRAAMLQPVSEASHYLRHCYVENAASVTNFYFDLLPEGRTELEERFYVSQEGTFSASVAGIQSLYAPQYRSRSKGSTLYSAK